MRTVRFAVWSAGQSVLSVPTKNAQLSKPNNRAQCAKSKKKGYYEAFRLLLENLVKADWQPTSHPPTERASVRRCLKNERHGRECQRENRISETKLPAFEPCEQPDADEKQHQHPHQRYQYPLDNTENQPQNQQHHDHKQQARQLDAERR